MVADFHKPSRLTPSLFKDAGQCGYRFRLNRLKLAGTGGAGEGYGHGSGVHDVLDKIYTAAMLAGYNGPMHAPRWVDRVYGLAFAAAEAEGLAVEDVPRIIEEVIDVLMGDQFFKAVECMGVEIWLEGDLPMSGRKLSARADKVMKVTTGVRIEDYKAKERPENFGHLEEDPQAIISLICARAMYPWARGYTFRHIYTTSRNTDEISKTASEIDWMARMHDGEFDRRAKRALDGPWRASTGPWCNWCPQREVCPQVGGQMVPGQPPPDPEEI